VASRAWVSRAVGVAFLAIAILVPFFPSLLPGLRGAMMTTGAM